MWVFRARPSRCPCWRSPRSSATALGRWPHSATFSRGETMPLLGDDDLDPIGDAVSADGVIPDMHRCADS
jgi:hypothetical protein